MQLNRPTETLRILEESLCDVGVWSWWGSQGGSHGLDSVEFEFTGVQLYFPPPAEGQPPVNQLGLRFTDPSFVAFVSRSHEDAPEANWADALTEDDCGPFPIDLEDFTLTSPGMLAALLKEAQEIDQRVGSAPLALPEAGAVLGFWAGPVGAVVMADNVELLGPDGVLAFDQIARLKDEWWAYWRRYWEARDAGEPLPEDYTCEATLPGGV